MRSAILLLCPGHELIGEESGCDVCPEGSLNAGDAKDRLIIESALVGHFLGPDSDDLLVGTFGCEPHVATLHGSALFSRYSGVWSIGRKYPGEWSATAARSATAASDIGLTPSRNHDNVYRHKVD
jgi:hypothetical protein